MFHCGSRRSGRRSGRSSRSSSKYDDSRRDRLDDSKMRLYGMSDEVDEVVTAIIGQQ